MTEKLEAADYPVRDTEVIERDDEEVEIVATLASTGATREELDRITETLAREASIIHATWTSSTVD